MATKGSVRKSDARRGPSSAAAADRLLALTGEAFAAEQRARAKAFDRWREMSAALHGLAVLAKYLEVVYASPADDAKAAEADFHVSLAKNLGSRVIAWRSDCWEANGGFTEEIKEQAKRAQKGTIEYGDIIPDPEAGIEL